MENNATEEKAELDNNMLPIGIKIFKPAMDSNRFAPKVQIINVSSGPMQKPELPTFPKRSQPKVYKPTVFRFKYTITHRMPENCPIL